MIQEKWDFVSIDKANGVTEVKCFGEKPKYYGHSAWFRDCTVILNEEPGMLRIIGCRMLEHFASRNTSKSQVPSNEEPLIYRYGYPTLLHWLCRKKVEYIPMGWYWLKETEGVDIFMNHFTLIRKG